MSAIAQPSIAVLCDQHVTPKSLGPLFDTWLAVIALVSPSSDRGDSGAMVLVQDQGSSAVGEKYGYVNLTLFRVCSVHFPTPKRSSFDMVLQAL